MSFSLGFVLLVLIKSLFVYVKIFVDLVVLKDQGKGLFPVIINAFLDIRRRLGEKMFFDYLCRSFHEYSMEKLDFVSDLDVNFFGLKIYHGKSFRLIY